MMAVVSGSVNYGWLPLSAGACLLVAFVVPYIIAVRLDHVYPILPFISDTGALHPENCVFGQMMNMASALLIVITYIRYKQVAQTGPTELQQLNNTAAFFGCVAAAGMSVVANFQIDLNSQHSLETVTHDFGALVCFGGGFFFSSAQSLLTYKLAADFWSWVMALLRAALSLAALIFIITTLELRDLANAEFNGTFAQTLQWNPYDGGYVYHVYSSAAEYLLGFTVLVLIVTFYKEFSAIKLPVQTNKQANEGVKGYDEVARDSLISVY